MKNKLLVFLNIHIIRKRISELGLKHYWLAEEIPVDRRTLMRWLNGQISQVARERAEKLSTLLELSLEEITLDRSAPAQLKVFDWEKKTVDILKSGELINHFRLSPNSWDLFLPLIALISQDSKNPKISELSLHQLGMAAMQKGDLNLAYQILQKSQDLAVKNNSLPILITNMALLGNWYMENEQLDLALGHLESAYAKKGNLLPYYRYQVVIDLANAYHLYGNYTKSLAILEKQLNIVDKFSFADQCDFYFLMARNYFEEKSYKKALNHIQKANKLEDHLDAPRQHRLSTFKALIYLETKKLDKLQKQILSSLEYEQFIPDLFDFWVIIRKYVQMRNEGEQNDLIKLLKKSARKSSSKIRKGRFYFQLSLIMQEENDKKKSSYYATRANTYFRECGALGRITP